MSFLKIFFFREAYNKEKKKNSHITFHMYEY
jgi:hypothetical protein